MEQRGEPLTLMRLMLTHRYSRTDARTHAHGQSFGSSSLAVLYLCVCLLSLSHIFSESASEQEETPGDAWQMSSVAKRIYTRKKANKTQLEMIFKSFVNSGKSLNNFLQVPFFNFFN